MRKAARRVLAIGSHPDDIEIGCGGTLINHANAGDEVTLLVVTNGEVGPGDTSVRLVEQHRAGQIMGVREVIFGELPDCEVSLHELKLVHLIERAIKATQADLIYTHDTSDSHQDHRAIGHCTLGAARFNSSILTYDSPSTLSFVPTVFVDITDTLEKKIEAVTCHASQVAASSNVSAERVRVQAAVRGHQARVPSAEGFVAIRLLMSI